MSPLEVVLVSLFAQVLIWAFIVAAIGGFLWWVHPR